MRIPTILAVLALAGIGSQAHAEDHHDTRHLLVACDAMDRLAQGTIPSVQESAEIMVCHAYLRGTWDTMLIMNIALEQPQRVCSPPGGLQNQQGARLFVKYLRAHPEAMDLPASLVYMAALVETYPCKRT
jgi:hypothetical protein